MKREAEDLALELKGIAATLYVMSGTFEDCESAALYSLGQHIEHLCEEVKALEVRS